ncbi:MAG: xanthine dehydrogenase family protein molybdopterin-binding subunit [Acidobacteria bacterium]|nr:xanthine dehydrogenase family protein molybdopterin-binding subunit [Acidobacteriota bacterium]
MTMETYYAPGELPETPEPKQRQDAWRTTRVVGGALPRIDAYERVSGTAVYPSDVQLPGMLHAAVLRCPHAHARVTRLDVARAEAMPGVLAVVHDGSPGADIPWHYDDEGKAKSRLFDPHCRHEGEEVAAVAAETPQQAWDAVRAIEVDYEVLPAVADAEDALAAGAAEVREGGNRIEGETYERGDVAAGFAAADAVVEMRFSTATELHTPLEPHGCLVRWDGGKLTVWESSQGVYGAQGEIAAVLRLPLSSVRVVGHYVGGGFGSKLSTGKWSVIAALLARRSGRPVRLFLTREETLLVAGNRPGNVMRLKAGATRDGRLTALDFEGIGSGGAYSPDGTGILDWLIRDLYTCPNVRSRTTSAYIHAGDERPMRAPGHPQGAWALEQTIDALAKRLDLDPIELRRRNVPTVSQARGGRPYTSTGLRRCLDEGAEAFGWTEARRSAEATQAAGGPVVRGVGMGAALWIAGAGGPPSTAIVKYFADGSVNLNMGASDIGTGTKTVMAMIVSEELGVPLERIQIEHADTATTQFATPSGGSKTVPSDGPAVRAAALDCVEQLLAMGAEELKLPAGELELRDGALVARGDPAKKIAVASIPAFRRRRVVVGVGYRGPNPQETATCPFAAQFCEVEIDRRTGEVRLLRFLGAHDSGRVMSRLTYDNQVYGGIVMGIGLGMTERRVLDRKQTGKMCNLSWHDYKIPTAMDVPAEMVSLPIEMPVPEANTIGAKGLGEPVTIPTAAAIANAVFHAVGIHPVDSPVNPTSLVEKLAAAGARAERSA